MKLKEEEESLQRDSQVISNDQAERQALESTPHDTTLDAELELPSTSRRDDYDNQMNTSQISDASSSIAIEYSVPQETTIEDDVMPTDERYGIR